MADYISREVARERLHKACSRGKILAFLVLIVGLVYAGIAAVIAMDVKVPDMVYDAMLVIEPLMANKVLAIADSGTRGFLLVLIAIICLLMFGKIAKSGDAFRTRQLKQLRLIAILVTLLGFLPTLVGNGVNIYFALSQGKALTGNISLSIDALCIGIGILLFTIARVFVAGSVLSSQEALFASDPVAGSMTEPNFSNVPDISSMTTAIPAAQPSGTTAVHETTSSDAFGVDTTQADQGSSLTDL